MCLKILESCMLRVRETVRRVDRSESIGTRPFIYTYMDRVACLWRVLNRSRRELPVLFHPGRLRDTMAPVLTSQSGATSLRSCPGR